MKDDPANRVLRRDPYLGALPQGDSRRLQVVMRPLS